MYFDDAQLQVIPEIDLEEQNNVGEDDTLSNNDSQRSDFASDEEVAEDLEMEEIVAAEV